MHTYYIYSSLYMACTINYVPMLKKIKLSICCILIKNHIHTLKYKWPRQDTSIEIP